MEQTEKQTKRVVLLASPTTYRTGAFRSAAEALPLELVIGVDLPPELAEMWRVPLALDFRDPQAATAALVAYAQAHPIDAILPTDDSATLLAAHASAALGLPANDPEAALAARDKFVMRQMLQAGGIPVPDFRCVPALSDAATLAAEMRYPCVVKPLRLSGSRGVIRADTPAEFIAAFQRLQRIYRADGDALDEAHILIEQYLPGIEVALDGLLTAGDLQLLALFDKPDPLEGPFFEETIYTTPSRLPAATQTAIVQRTAAAARALGLRTGPVHAELRLNDEGVWLIEMAGRSIGGLCSSILEFGTGVCLEELILRHAAGLPLPPLNLAVGGAGVMMIPIPSAGILRGVTGIEAAQAVPHITGVEISARLNTPLVPLPEGSSYLGFLFARAENPTQAEAALREAHAKLHFEIEPEIPVLRSFDIPLIPTTPPPERAPNIKEASL